MAKKKPAKNKKSAAGRVATKKTARKPVPVRKPVVKQNPRKGARVVPSKKKPPAALAPVEVTPSLGRPKVTGEEDLDMFFKEDYHARQIFKFLNVRTLKDLERYSAGEILRRLSNPIKETVERIRRSLAHHNRCLNGDETYALEHKDEVPKILRSV